MDYQQGSNFAHRLQHQGHQSYQQPLYQPLNNPPCPAEDDPEQGLSDLAAKLGISPEDFLEQWAQITASADNPFSFLTENLDINSNGSLYESTYDYSGAGSSFDMGSLSGEQQTTPNQEFCVSPQDLFVNPSQNTLSSRHVGYGGSMGQSAHVFAPLVPFNTSQYSTHAPGDTNNVTQTNRTPNGDVTPWPDGQDTRLIIPIMYPILDPHKLGLLQPGYYHLLSHDPVPTPQNMLEGSLSAAMRMIDEGVITMAQMRDVVLIVPRPTEFIGNPSMPTIVFADLNRRGRPGPYVRDVLNGDVRLQGATDWVLEHTNWKTTPLRLNWPGCVTSSEVISCTNRRGQPLTRTELAQIVASKVVALFQQATKIRKFPQSINPNTAPWDLRRINPMKVRLIGVSYYRKLWVPILATNAKSRVWDNVVGPFPAVAHPDRTFPSALAPRLRASRRDYFRPQIR